MLELISTIKIILDIWNVVVWDMNYINSLRPSDAYLRQPPRPSMIDAKPLYEPMLTYRQWNPWKRRSVETPSKHNNLHKKCFWKCRLQKDCHVVSALFFSSNYKWRILRPGHYVNWNRCRDTSVYIQSPVSYLASWRQTHLWRTQQPFWSRVLVWSTPKVRGGTV